MANPLNERTRRLLKERAVPVLRELGFKGSFPHFYRERDGKVDLCMFMFSMSGFAFVVELSYRGPRGENVFFEPETPVRKLRVTQTKERHRLGSGPPLRGDRWFVFDPRHPPFFEGEGRLPTPEEHVEEVIHLLRTEAEEWWRSHTV